MPPTSRREVDDRRAGGRRRPSGRRDLAPVVALAPNAARRPRRLAGRVVRALAGRGGEATAEGPPPLPPPSPRLSGLAASMRAHPSGRPDDAA